MSNMYVLYKLFINQLTESKRYSLIVRIDTTVESNQNLPVGQKRNFGFFKYLYTALVTDT